MMSGNAVLPTSTCAQARVMLYQPSQRPRYTSTVWFSSFGRCQVVGRLGQRHADLLEAILFNAERRRDTPDGSVEMLVDPARVRRTLSDSRYSMEQIKKLLMELRAAAISIETPAFDFPLISGLIDHIEPSLMTRRDPLTGGRRHLWTVRLGKALLVLLERDLWLHYDPAPIARLQHGITQAVIRHIQTHTVSPRGGWFMDTVIKAVLVNPSTKELRKARLRLRSEVSACSEMGIRIAGDKIFKIITPSVPSVPQTPDSVPQAPDGVPQTPGAFHTRPMETGLSGLSGLRGAARA